MTVGNVSQYSKENYKILKGARSSREVKCDALERENKQKPKDPRFATPRPGQSKKNTTRYSTKLTHRDCGIHIDNAPPPDCLHD